jgi:hypothetical protein
MALQEHNKQGIGPPPLLGNTCRRARGTHDSRKERGREGLASRLGETHDGVHTVHTAVVPRGHVTRAKSHLRVCARSFVERLCLFA